MIKKTAIIFCCMMAGISFADEVRLVDGTLLKGVIREIREGQIEIDTLFSSALKVDRALVAGFVADQPMFVRLDTGTVVQGTVSDLTKGVLEIAGDSGTVQTALSSVQQGWGTAGQDPELIALKKAEEALRRKWKYKVVANLSGRSGNSDERRVGANASAVLAGKNDELKLYGSYARRESNGKKSSDERVLGMRYTSYFRDPWGWYVRQEFEEEKFKNIKLRSTSAIGFSYRKQDEKKKKLVCRSGLNYRHEQYVDGRSDSSNLGLDLGLDHFFGRRGRFEIHNTFTFVPSLEDFSNYLITQDSYLDVPFNDSNRWKMRFGLRNDYDSQPAGDLQNLDTRYYSSLVAEWD